MATTESNSFEIERRVIMFKSTTTLPDGSTLGYNGNPNVVINGNTAGETLIYNCPMNTRYSESDGSEWAKESLPNVWVMLGAVSLLELEDTPISYVNGKYLRSTTSGVVWVSVSSEAGSFVHSEFSSLDYASAGHTGFASSEDLTTVSGLTDTNASDISDNTTLIATTSGTLQTNINGKSDTGHIHDDRYYIESEVDTISGALNTKINSKPDILLELSDTPDIYEDGEYLRSTTSGVEWTIPEAESVIIRVKEENTSAITKGQVCAIVGSSGVKAEVCLCDCDNVDKVRNIGLAQKNIPQNENGIIVYKGILEEVDTRTTNSDINPYEETWTPGTLLWASNIPGGLTKVRPISGRSIKAARTVKGNNTSDVLIVITHVNPVWATTASDEDIILRVGDSVGTNKVSIRNYVNEEKAAFDSYGNLTTSGTIDGVDVATFKSDFDSHLHDDMYYTESEVDTISGSLDAKIPGTLIDLSDTPNVYDINKYLRSTVSGTEWATVSGGTGTSIHSDLSNLAYADSGHTGFASSVALLTTSGSLQTGIDEKSDAVHIHDDRYYIESETDTISGTLNTKIDSKPDIFLELSDTPDIYDTGKYLRSTTTGIEWSTVSGVGSSDVQTFLDLTDTPTTYSGHAGNYLKVSLDEYGLEYVDVQGTATTTVSGWSIYDATTYYADFEHNLSTEDISVFIVDTVTNKEVGVEDIEITNVNTIRVYVTDDTSSLKINVITGGFGTSQVSFRPKNVTYVAKNGSDATETGGVNNPFLTIQAAIDYIIEKDGSISDATNQALIIVYPGTYIEQIHSVDGIHIVGVHSPNNRYHKGARLVNDGTSESNYPIRSGINDKYRIYGLSIETTDGTGIIGKLPVLGIFESCFFNGQWIENTIDQRLFDLFEDCDMRDGNGMVFNLTGTNLLGGRNIALKHTSIIRSTPTFVSTNNLETIIRAEDGTSLVGSSFRVGGNWGLRAIKSTIANGRIGIEGRSQIGTVGDVSIIECLMSSGLHFTENPNSLILINSSFSDGEERIPVDEADITADVDIIDVDYNGNYQCHGIDGEIKIVNSTKIVGSGLTDSYKTINEAFKASKPGDLLRLGAETYETNVVVPEGINVIGINNKDTIVTSISGTTVTLSGSLPNTFSRMSIYSTPSGTVGDHALESTGGTCYFNDCIIGSTATETCTNAIFVYDATIVLKNSLIEYGGIGSTTGSGIHRLTYFDGTAGLDLRDSTARMIIADTNSLADASVFESTASGTEGTFIETYLLGNVIEFNATSPLWNGNCYGYRALGIGNNRNVLSNTIKLQGGGGTGNGCWYVLDTSNNAGGIKSSSNRIKVTDFANNYFGNIATGDTLLSHFDDISADGGVIGDGIYSFVNSPNPGDIRISGAYINMYDNDIVVAKRGGEFTSLKEALESITDNSSLNRYNIHVHSGFYTEDNPIELKPYVYIYGQFKHNPRIIPANPLEHLFVIPTGYCTTDLGELTLQAPAGDSTHQVYMIYAAPGCKPIMGVYQCLFLGDNSNYCNGFRNNELLSGYHIVNCMTYGAFNRFAYITGGNWTDSGFIPEATTVMNYYLYMDGEGVALIDLMRAKCPDFAHLFYVDHADAELIVSDIYAEDQQTLTTGPNGGKVRMRGSTFHGKNSFNGGDITIHGGIFEDNSYIEALTGNLESLSVTSTKNKNENTHCINVTGGGTTKIYLGGGNIFDSPNGLDSIKLDGTFAEVQVEGIRQYGVSCLASGVEHTFEHLPDLDYSRMVQIQAYPGVAGSDSIEYLTVDESKYIQEDDSKTTFSGDTVTLSGVGSTAYGHWHLNKGGGNAVAVDSSGNGRNGVLYNMEPGDWSAPGKLGAYCLSFNASDEHVKCGNIAGFDYDDVFSLDFWYNTTNTASQYAVSKMSYITSSYRGYGAFTSDHRMFFVLASDDMEDDWIAIRTEDQFSSGVWHHCIITYDGSADASGVHIWIDGQDKTLVVVANNLTGTTICAAEFQISGRNGTNDVWAGRLDEVVVYEQELTSIEVAYRYNSGTGTESLLGTHPTTEGYYVTTASGSSIDISTWTNIGGMLFDETIKSNTQIRYLLSVDAKVNWNYWSGGSWAYGTLSGIDTYGNSSSILESLNAAAFDSLFTTSSGTLDVAASLKTTSSYTAPVLNQVCINYSTPGSKDRLGSNTMKVTYVDSTHTKITNVTDKLITGIKCNILKIHPY